jgi:hypothetical protein
VRGRREQRAARPTNHRSEDTASIHGRVHGANRRRLSIYAERPLKSAE